MNTKTNKTPPTPQSVDLSVFSTPQKKTKAVLLSERTRDRYRNNTIEAGLPPKLAKLITDRHGTPKRIAPVVAAYTGRCHLTNIKLTDIGDGLTGVVYQAKQQRFITTLVYEVILASKLTEDNFIQLCGLITKVKNDNNSMGGQDRNRETQSRSNRPRPTDTGEYRTEDFFGVRQ